MDLMLSLIDEGFHLGSAIAALMLITNSVYVGMDSVDEVTSVIHKCLMLHFHLIRLRTGSGVLLEIAVWVLDMAFHLWFLLVDCTRGMSSLYFKNGPLQTLHCVLLFIFHLQILRRYCMGIHVTVENVANPAEDAHEVVAAEPAPVAPSAMLTGEGGSGAGSGGREYEDSSIQGSQTLQQSSKSTSKLTSTVNEPSFPTPKPTIVVPWKSCSSPRIASRDELPINIGRPVDDSDGSVPVCRCCRRSIEKPAGGVLIVPSETNVNLPGPSAGLNVAKQVILDSLSNSAAADEPVLKLASLEDKSNAMQAEDSGALSLLSLEVVLAYPEDRSSYSRLVPSDTDLPGAEEALRLPCKANKKGFKDSQDSHSLSCLELLKPIIDHSDSGELFLGTEHAEPNLNVTSRVIKRQPSRLLSPENVVTPLEGGAFSLSLVPSDTWSFLGSAAERRPSELGDLSPVEADVWEKKPDGSFPSLRKLREVNSDDLVQVSSRRTSQQQSCAASADIVRAHSTIASLEIVPWDSRASMMVPVGDNRLASRETSLTALYKEDDVDVPMAFEVAESVSVESATEPT